MAVHLSFRDPKGNVRTACGQALPCDRTGVSSRVTCRRCQNTTRWLGVQMREDRERDLEFSTVEKPVVAYKGDIRLTGTLAEDWLAVEAAQDALLHPDEARNHLHFDDLWWEIATLHLDLSSYYFDLTWKEFGRA